VLVLVLTSKVEAAVMSEITQPVHKATVTNPVDLTGTYTSLDPLDRIDLLIRNSSGEFWNGTSFQAEWIAVHPTVSGRTWSYSIESDLDGDISVNSRAWDIQGMKQTYRDYINFGVSNNVPVANIDSLVPGDSYISPVTISGTVTEVSFLDRVQLVLKNTDGEFWNGASYQSDWAGVNADVSGSRWSYDFSPVDDAEIDVKVKAIDITGSRQLKAAKQYFFVTEPDEQEPVASIAYPATDSAIQYPLQLSGQVFDNDQVASVRLVLKDVDTVEYWNGFEFQNSWIDVAADIQGDTWSYAFDGGKNQRLLIKARAIDAADNRQSSAAKAVVEVLHCEHRVTGTATPANSGTPAVIDSETISFTTGTVISANFFNSGAITDRQGRTVSLCVTEGDANQSRRAQIVADVGQTDNTIIKAYPQFIVGSKFGLVGETSFRPYPVFESTTGFKYPDLVGVGGLTGLPAYTDNLPDIDISLDIDEQNVVGAERDVMIESWFYDVSANGEKLGKDLAGNDIVNSLNNIVGDGHPNPDLMNLVLEMMVHVGALSSNDVSQAARNPSQHRLTDVPVTIGDFDYHIWYGDTHLAPLVVFSRETDIAGNYSMNLSDEGQINLDWNQFLEFTLLDLEQLLAKAGVSWASGSANIFPTLRDNGAIGAVEVGVEPQINNAEDLPYVATFNKLGIVINGQQFGFE